MISILVGVAMGVAERFIDSGEKEGMFQTWAALGLVFSAYPVFMTARRHKQLRALRAKLHGKN